MSAIFLIKPDGIPINLANFVSGSISFFIYSLIFVFLKGRTPGKIINGLSVVSTSGGQVSNNKKALRELLKIILISIPFIGQIFLIINLLIVAFSKSKQSIHDKVFKTLVIKNEPTWSIKKQLIVIIFIVLAVAGLVFFYLQISKVAKNQKLSEIVKKTTQVQSNSFIEFVNTRDGWKIKYESYLYSEPFAAEPFGGRKEDDHKYSTFISEKDDVKPLCYSSIEITTMTNLTQEEIATQKNFYIADKNEVKPVTINGNEGYRVFSNSNVLVKERDMVTYFFPKVDKVYLINYIKSSQNNFSEEICDGNQDSIEKMISTFELI